MAGSHATRLLALVGFFTLVSGCLARSQEAAQPGASPDELLKSLGLTRSASTWVLPDEKSVLKDLRDARELYRRVAQGMLGQRMLAYNAQNRQAALMQLRQQSAVMNQQIAQLDTQINALADPLNASGGYAQMQQNQLSQQRNRLVAANNQMVNQLNALQEQAQAENKDPAQDPSHQLSAEVAESREKYMQAVLDLRKSVDLVMAKYSEIAKKPETAKALADLTASTKNHHKLGPSKALLDAIKQLERAEGSVQSANIELKRVNGVFHLYATLNRVPTNMIFDTGAGLTTISSALAKKIGLKPRPDDSTVHLKTADGTVVDSKLMTIPSVRVGKFTIPNVECAVMPAEKGDVDPLLGQSFLKFFKVDFSPELGRLNLKKVETAEADSSSLDRIEPARPATKATARSRRSSPPHRAPAKSKRSKKTRRAPPGGLDQPPPGGLDQPPADDGTPDPP
jgi:clan AA aspartic protease (TIGR02281 family)